MGNICGKGKTHDLALKNKSISEYKVEQDFGYTGSKQERDYFYGAEY